MLQPMKHPRYAVALSGLASHLIALGGYNRGFLDYCEKYEVASNSWNDLPRLNNARDWAGCLLFESMRAFCICGCQGQQTLSSIESLELGKDPRWMTIPFDDNIMKPLCLTAA